jgi:transcriptional regulator with XRE-family HTH domain
VKNEAICKLVGRRLRQRRRLLDLTQRQVAAKCGLTFQQIQKYEAGMVDMSIVRLLVLADILRIAPAEILDGWQACVGAEDRFVTHLPPPLIGRLGASGAADHAAAA